MQTVTLNAEDLNLNAWLEIGDGESVILAVLYRAWGGVPEVGARVALINSDEIFTATEKLVQLFRRAERLAKDHSVDLRSAVPDKAQIGVWMLAQREQMN